MSHYVLDARTATPHFPGIGRYVSNLARAMVPLLAADERLTIICDPAHPIHLPSSEAIQAIPLAVSPFSLRQQWIIPRLLRNLRQRPTSNVQRPSSIIYHSPYVAMPYLPGVPSLLTVYDLIPLRYPEHSTRRARLLVRWMTRLALRVVRHIIAISDFTRRDFMAEFGLAPERITAIPLAADPAFCPQPPEAIAAVRVRYGLPETFALYLGSNKPHKNLPRLVEAWQMADGGWQMADGRWQMADGGWPMADGRWQMADGRWRMADGGWPMADGRWQMANGGRRTAEGGGQRADCGLVIAGAWDARYPEARRLAESAASGAPIAISNLQPPTSNLQPPTSNLQSPIPNPHSPLWLGPIPDADLPALYAAATVFVFPSLYEGFGLPVLEAMACGTPVICSNTSSLPEVAGDAAVMVNPLDVNALAAALGQLLSDADLRTKGLAQARRFSWEHTARQTLDLYRACAAGPAA